MFSGVACRTTFDPRECLPDALYSRIEKTTTWGGNSEAIAGLLRAQAIQSRRRTTVGFLDSLRHPARYEDDAFGDVVIDVEHIQWFLTNPKGRTFALAAEGELRKWLAGEDPGLAERALYVLVHLLGPGSDVVLPALVRRGRSRSVALEALSFFPELPAALLPALAPLVTAKGKVAADALFEDAALIVDVLQRIRSDDVASVLLSMLERDELRAAILDSLSGQKTQRLTHVPLAVRERFTRAIGVIEKSRTAGLPSRPELATAASILALIERDAAMALAALGILDLLIVAKASRGTSSDVEALVAFLTRNVDSLDAPSLAKLAAFLAMPVEQRYPAAAAAWVRLPLGDAKTIANKLGVGAPALSEARWRAVADAAAALPAPRPEIEALIPRTFRQAR